MKTRFGITGATSLHHAGAIVDDNSGLLVFIHHHFEVLMRNQLFNRLYRNSREQH
jgi:hypothetical protein